MARIASNSYPMRSLFKTRNSARVNPETEAMKKKYGEITMLDFPQFTKDTFPDVHHMDVWSSLFGDFSDGTMFAQNEFNPASASGRKWLDQFASKIATTGVKVTIENHWGVSADPIHVRTILDEVNHPFCEASPERK